MRKVYLDTCIVIYLVEKTPGFHEKALRWLSMNTDAILCVSPLVRFETLVKPMRDNSVPYSV